MLLLNGLSSLLHAQSCTVSISGNSTYCTGANTTLTANATGSTGYSYLWNTGATTQSITVSNQGTYSVTVTGQNTGGNTNIITNGDFAGGNTGFSSDYYYNSNSSSRNYTVTNNSQIWNSLFEWSYSNCSDHTSTSNNMQLLARGSSNASNRVWYVTVPVTQNTVYDLSAWASAVSSTLFSSNYALLQIEVNGVLLGSSTRMTGSCNWHNMTTTWNSGSTTLATVAIRDLNTASSNDNNFVLDDISMIPRTVPGCVISGTKSITMTPLSAAEAGIDLNQCNDATFTMAANAPVSGVGRWSVVNGTATIADVNAANTGVTITSTSATLRWTITNGTCTSSSDVVLNNSTGAAGLFCNCGPIFGTSYGGTNTNYSDQLREVSVSNGSYGAQLGNTLNSTSAAIALDNVHQRLYYVGNSSNTTIYYINNSGTSSSTGVALPGSINYNRTGFNPVDKNLYFVNSDGTYWVQYTPTASGSGGTTKQYTTRIYSPTTAPTLGGTNIGGDIVFDADGNCYLVTNPGHFYKVNFNDATNTATLTYLGQMILSMTQIAALAFSTDGKLFVSGNGNDVYYVNLQTLKETKVNTSNTSGTGDFASCNFPVIRPELQANKSFRKLSGSSGTTLQTNDIVEYTINIQNIGDISAGNVKFQDNIPVGTSYIAGSTKLNGVAVSDVSGAMPFSIVAGGFINSYDQATQSGAISPVPYSATIKFQVRITSTGNVVRNVGSITHSLNNEVILTNPVEFAVCNTTTGITIGANPFCAGQSTTLTANEEGTNYLWSTGATTRSIAITTGGTYTITVTKTSNGGGGNILTNSDFSAGNTGFSTDYTNGTGGWGVYNITNQANTFFSFALPCPDHDSKTNNMFVADGSATTGQRVWYQTVNVLPNTTYNLSAWGQAIVNYNPSRLYFAINGTRIGDITTLAALDCAWQQFTTEWNSGSNTSITLAIMNDNIDGNGNDFSIDDITMIPQVAPSCAKIGTINVNLFTPTTATAGLDTVRQCNTNIFNLSGNAPGVGETGHWELLNGTATFANANAATTTVTVTSGTVTSVRWVIDEGGCISTATKTLINADEVPPVLSGVPSNTTVSCENIPTAANPTATDNCALENIVFQEVYSSCSNPILNNNSGIENISNVAMDTTFFGYPAKKLPNYSTALTGWEMGFPATATTPALLVNDNTNTINNPNGNDFMWVPSNSYCVLNNPVTLQAGQCIEISLWAASLSNINPQQSTRIQVEVFRVSDNQAFEPYAQVLPASVSITNMNWQRIVTKFVTPTAGAYKFVVTQEVDPVYGPTPKGFALDGFELKNCCETAPAGCKNYTITRTWTARDRTGNATKQSQIITVTDTNAPTFNNVPANITVCEIVPAAATVTATDNCDATPSVSLTSEVSTKTNNGTCTDNFYTVTRTWTATDNCGNTRTAQQVITVMGSFKPIITASPFCIGGSTTLSATLPTCIASATYQWQYYNGSAWTNVGSGATYTTGTLTANQTYRVIVTVSGSACTGTADDFIATPASALNVTVTTPSATICVNSTSFLTANVTGGAGAFTYQWQRNSNNGNSGWMDIVGATNANFPIPTSVADITYYRVIVTASGSGCGSSTAQSIKITVANNAGCDCVVQNCSAYSKLTFKDGTVLNDVAGLEGDKWLFKNVATGYDAIIEITKAVNAQGLNTVDNTGVNIDDWCPEINWNYIAGEDSYLDWKITIVAAGTQTPANLPSSSRVTSYDVDGNSNFREIHRHINANGFILNNPTELSIEANAPYSTVVGSTTEHTGISTDSEVKATFYYPGQNNVFEIRLGVRTTNAVASFTRQYAVSFDPCITYTNPDINPQAPEIAGIDTACTGGGVATYTTTQPFVSYNWTVAGGTIVSGQGTRTVTVNWATTGAQSISVTTSDANSCIITKAFAVQVTNPITVSVQPVGFTECVGGTRTLTATVTGGYDLQYQWQSSEDNSNWADIASANALIYKPLSVVVATTYYRLVVTSTSTNCATIQSSSATVIIVDDPKVNVTVASSTLCEGGSVTLTANITDGTGTCTAQWQKSTTITPWANIAGATSNTLNTASLNSTTRYRVLLNCSGNGCCD